MRKLHNAAAIRILNVNCHVIFIFICCGFKTEQPEARFPFKRNRLRCVRCVRCLNENRKKRKRLRCRAANHGCHCFDRAFLWLALAFVASRNKRKRQPTMIGCLPTQALAFLGVFVYATHATQAIAFEWKPGFTKVVLLCYVNCQEVVKAHTYGDLNRVVYSEPPTIKINEKL